MKQYLNQQQAIIGLHEKGYIYDFESCGTGLLWIQEKVVVQPGNFSVLEYHRFEDEENDHSFHIVFGIFVYHHHVKGILIKHCTNNKKNALPVITEEVKQYKLI